MALTPEQQRLREGKLSASAISCLMTGDTDKMLALWRLMIGDPSYVQDDLSRVWPVRLGETTEALNLEWYEYKSGRALKRGGEVVTHPQHEWACATLDGFDDGLVGPVDGKHVGGFEKREVIVARYTPQMTWQMDVTGTTVSALSIIEGAREPVIEIVGWDAEYSAELWRRAHAFMECVWTLTPPVKIEPVAPPVAAVKEYDFGTNNQWAVEAGAWLEHRDSAKRFAAAEKELKAAVPADAARCFGHGIAVTRDRASRLSIRESK